MIKITLSIAFFFVGWTIFIIKHFSRVYNFDKITESNLAAFSEVVNGVRKSHEQVQYDLATGIQNLQDAWKKEERGELPDLSPWLDPFYTNRISIRVILAQHLALSRKNQKGFVGNIEVNCKPRAIAEDAANNARRLCEDYYGDAPKLEFLGCSDSTFSNRFPI